MNAKEDYEIARGLAIQTQDVLNKVFDVMAENEVDPKIAIPALGGGLAQVCMQMGYTREMFELTVMSLWDAFAKPPKDRSVQ